MCIQFIYCNKYKMIKINLIALSDVINAEINPSEDLFWTDRRRHHKVKVLRQRSWVREAFTPLAFLQAFLMALPWQLAWKNSWERVEAHTQVEEHTQVPTHRLGQNAPLRLDRQLTCVLSLNAEPKQADAHPHKRACLRSATIYLILVGCCLDGIFSSWTKTAKLQQ